MSANLSSGSAFGEYVLERLLGGGGFGDVWLARNAAGGAVALKVLMGQYQTAEAAKLRAEIELLAASASSRSKHIVRVLGGGSEPMPYVVMEYIDGVDLAHEIGRRGALPADEVLGIAEGIADALAALQQAGIIHRDVKPGNVMIDTQGVVKLMDFGIAKIVGLDTMTSTSQTPMSMAYAAPEVWEGRASYLSDHYAFGALLYQCLSGRPVFNGSYAEIYNHHRLTPPDLGSLPASTPAALRRLVDACLAKETSQRPQTADDLLRAIRAAQAEIADNADKTVFVARVIEPKTLGPWVIDSRSSEYDWTFECHHETSGDKALVEVHFSNDLEYGQTLRKAVATNPALVPYGAERLITTSRLVLRPGESWRDSPSANFLFWVAREGAPASVAAEAPELRLEELKTVTQTLQAFIDVASTEGLKLDLSEGNLALKTDGTLFVRRPGIGPFPETDHVTAAMDFLKTIPIRETPAPVSEATVVRPLEAALTSIERLPEATPASALSAVYEQPQAPAKATAMPATADKGRNNILIFGAVGIVLAILAVIIVPRLIGSKDNGGKGIVVESGTSVPSGTATNVASRLTAADAALAAKDYDTAISEYSKVLAADAKNTAALFGRGSAYLAQKKNDLALPDYTKAIDLNPRDARYFAGRGDVYFAQKNWDLAIADYSKGIDLDPRNSSAYFNRGYSQANLKKYDAAVLDYNKVIELRPRDNVAFNNRGNAYFHLAKNDLALVDLNESIEIEPKYALAYGNRGDVYRDQGKTDPAWVDYSKAIELDPSYYNAYFGRGLLSLDAKYWDGAVTDFTKVIQLSPNEPNGYNNRGNAYTSLRRYDLALADYNKAIQLDPTVFNPWRNRGILYQNQGRNDLARADFEKAKSLAKTPDEMQRAQSSLDSLR